MSIGCPNLGQGGHLVVCAWYYGRRAAGTRYPASRSRPLSTHMGRVLSFSVSWGCAMLADGCGEIGYNRGAWTHQASSNHLTFVLIFSVVTDAPFPVLPSQYAFPALHRFVTELVHRNHPHTPNKGVAGRIKPNSLDVCAAFQHGHSSLLPYAPPAICIPCLHRFVTELVHRKHPHIPGEDVGQQLVLGKCSDTLGEVLSKIAGHGIHRWEAGGGLSRIQS